MAAHSPVASPDSPMAPAVNAESPSVIIQVVHEATKPVPKAKEGSLHYDMDIWLDHELCIRC